MADPFKNLQAQARRRTLSLRKENGAFGLYWGHGKHKHRIKGEWRDLEAVRAGIVHHGYTAKRRAA